MTIYTLMHDGRIVTITDFELPGKNKLEAIAAAIGAAGIEANSKGIARAEVWGDPLSDSPAKAERDGMHYSWLPADPDVVANAYRLAGGQIDDYLPTLRGASV